MLGDLLQEAEGIRSEGAAGGGQRTTGMTKAGARSRRRWVSAEAGRSIPPSVRGDGTAPHGIRKFVTRLGPSAQRNWLLDRRPDRPLGPAAEPSYLGQRMGWQQPHGCETTQVG